MIRECLLEIDCRIRPEKRREFTLSADSLNRTEGEGHLRTVIYEDRDESDHILWVEEWTARELLDRYLASDTFAALLGGLKTLGTIFDCRVVQLGDPEGGYSGSSPRRLSAWKVR